MAAGSAGREAGGTPGCCWRSVSPRRGGVLSGPPVWAPGPWSDGRGRGHPRGDPGHPFPVPGVRPERRVLQ